ncbi:MAG TPA: alkaline phosphatase family protein [Acidobacteriota bacterium]|jgi:YVTN family beta-propeller protein
MTLILLKRKYLKISLAITLCVLAGAAAYSVGRQLGIFPVFRSSVPLGKQPDGTYLLPSNQVLRPPSQQILIPGRPVDLAMNASKNRIAILNSRGVLILDAETGARLGEIKSASTSYAGIAFRPNSDELWASEATRNGPDGILIASVPPAGEPRELARIRLRGHPVPTGIAFSADGTQAFVALSRNNTLAVIDTGSRDVTLEVDTGIAPFGVAVSDKLGRVYVSNRGGRRPSPTDTAAPTSGSLIASDPVTGAGVSGTVSVIEMKTISIREVVVGLAPSSITLSPDGKALAVANSHSDSISLIDAETLVRRDVPIPAFPHGTLGSQPVGVAFSSDGQALYVACGGNNAVAVLGQAARIGAKRGSIQEWTARGALPVMKGALGAGWFPSAVAIGADGALRVVNIKGVGNTADGKGTFNSRQYEGSLVKIPAPGPRQLAAGTREVQEANRPVFEPSGGIRNLPALGIRHVFLIIKENRTYDQVFGDMPKGNGDPKLVMFGRDITPNHHALAERYVLLDNFYASGAISFDGHHWLMQAFVSDYVERAFSASPRGYAWNMSDALTIAPAGFFWQKAPLPLDVRIYGEFALPVRRDPAKQNAVDMDDTELLTWSEYWRSYKEGKWRDVIAVRSGIPALTKYLSPRFPPSNQNIPDQIRAEAFLEEFAEREKKGTVPNLSIIALTCDHTMGTRPGAPTPRAMVADNDLALGRVVERISRSNVWPRSLILVVEDDAQNGVDHVDGHRTVALAIGPHVRRSKVDSNNYNHTSMVRTIQEIFQIPPRTRALQSARAMNSVFTGQPDTGACETLTPEVRLDEMNPPLNALNGRAKWAARQSLAMNWSEVDDVPEDVLNRILWWNSKGFDVAYPSAQKARSEAAPGAARRRP